MFQQACEVEIALQVWRFAGLAQIQNPEAPAVKRDAEEDWGN